MKYLIMTSPNSQGISEVFYSLLLPVDSAPNDLIARWDKLVENSPITVVLSEEKPDKYSFLIGKEVTSILTVHEGFGNEPKLAAGFSDPVVIKSVEDDDITDLGYFWNGNEFLDPESI